MSAERRSGTRLNADRLDRFLALRGLNARQFATIAGVHEVTLSRARHGHRVTESTLRKIAAALQRVEPLPGLDALLNQIEEA